MRNNKLFSIIIPTLNEERYLPKLLKDLADQTFKDFDVVIVDARSRDRTKEFAMAFRDKLNIKIINSWIKNVSYQRNKGARKSSGEWLLFIDSDSRLSKNFLNELSLKVEQEEPDVFSLWCNPDTKSESDRAIANFINITFDFMRVLNYPSALGAFIGVKRVAFLKTRGFDKKLIYAEDGKFIRDCVAKNFEFKFFRKPEFTYSFRRWRKDGTLEVLRQHILLHAKRLSNLEITKYLKYEMGGDRYDKN